MLSFQLVVLAEWESQTLKTTNIMITAVNLAVKHKWLDAANNWLYSKGGRDTWANSQLEHAHTDKPLLYTTLQIIILYYHIYSQYIKIACCLGKPVTTTDNLISSETSVNWF